MLAEGLVDLRRCISEVVSNFLGRQSLFDIHLSKTLFGEGSALS